MVKISIDVDDIIYEQFKKVCDALNKDIIAFIQERVDAEMANHVKMLSEEFDTNI